MFLFCRVPELLFQPSMIGLEQAGIAETMNFVFGKFSAEDQDKLAQVSSVYMTPVILDSYEQSL